MKRKIQSIFLLAFSIVIMCTFSGMDGKKVMAADAADYNKMAVANVKSGYLNVRAKGASNAAIVGRMKAGSVATIVKKGKDWTKIKSGKVTGFVSSNYILTGKKMQAYIEKNYQKKAEVIVNKLNVRKKASTEAKVLTQLKKGKKFPVVKESKDWVTLKVSKNTGYAAKEFVNLYYTYRYAEPVSVTDGSNSSDKDRETPDVDTTSEAGELTTPDEIPIDEPDVPVPEIPDTKPDDSTENTTEEPVIPPVAPSQTDAVVTDVTGDDIVAYAKQFEGNPYVYGGTSLTNGADCSGFTLSVYKNFNIQLPRTSAAQSKVGKLVSIDELLPGDLIFYGYGTSVTHVSLYIGDGEVIHALGAKYGIVISRYDYNTPLWAKRIIANS